MLSLWDLILSKDCCSAIVMMCCAGHHLLALKARLNWESTVPPVLRWHMPWFHWPYLDRPWLKRLIILWLWRTFILIYNKICWFVWFFCGLQMMVWLTCASYKSQLFSLNRGPRNRRVSRGWEIRNRCWVDRRQRLRRIPLVLSSFTISHVFCPFKSCSEKIMCLYSERLNHLFILKLFVLPVEGATEKCHQPSSCMCLCLCIVWCNVKFIKCSS